MAVLLTYCVQLGLFPVLWCLTVWLYKFNSSNFLIHVSSCFPLNSMVGLIVNFRIVVGKRRVVKIISLERKFAVSFLTCLCICCSVAQSLWFFVTPWTTGVTRSLKSLLQHHNLKASILRNSAFCYGPALTSIRNYWKTIALAIGTFVGKVRSLLFSMLFVKAFFPRSKRLLIYAYICYCCSVMSDSMTPWTAAHQASMTFTISLSLLKLMSIESMMPSNHLILCHPLLLLPTIFPSIRNFCRIVSSH